MITIKLLKILFNAILLERKIKRDKKLQKSIYKRKNTKQGEMILLGDKGLTGNIKSNKKKEENDLQDLHD